MSTLFALSSEISTEYDNIKKKQPDTPYTEDGSVQTVEVEESTQQKWVNLQTP